MQRVGFPPGSEPFMLRVSPDGRYVWVQTSATGTNVVLDADSMEVLGTTKVGTDPEQSAFQPDGAYGLIAHLASDDLVVLESPGGSEVKRIPFDTSQGNISFAPDGATAFVSSPGSGEVFVIDMATLSIRSRIDGVPGAMGLVLLKLQQ